MFANQEPETNETMNETCKINFGVTFTLSEKIL
jgi:glutathione peroxidase